MHAHKYERSWYLYAGLVATVTALLVVPFVRDAVLVEALVVPAVEIAPINNTRSLAHQICMHISMSAHTHKYV